MRKYLVLILLVASCKSTPVTTQNYASSVLSEPSNAERVYNVPVEVVPESKLPELAPVDNHLSSTFVTIPASSVPTVLEIIPQKKKIFRKKSDPVAPVVVVSSAPEIKAQTPTSTPMWYYWAAIIILVLAAFVILSKYFSSVISPIKIAYEFIKRIFRG